jgi:general stress protein YciG
MANNGQQDQKQTDQPGSQGAPMEARSDNQQGGTVSPSTSGSQNLGGDLGGQSQQGGGQSQGQGLEGRPVERNKQGRTGARGTAAMDPDTRKEVARKGGQAVSRNRQHMAEIGRKGGQSVSKNREHMAKIGRKGGAASRGHH